MYVFKTESFQFSVGIYLVMELLGHTVILCLAF